MKMSNICNWLGYAMAQLVGSLNLLEPSGPVQASNGIALCKWLEPENRIIIQFFL